ncbi:9368_t:CDS:1, partial [Cetraspora pellucida]
ADISSEGYSDNLDLLNALKDRINIMFIKIQRLEGRNRRLETKEIYFQAEIDSLKRESKDLIKENETLKNEKTATKNAVSHLDEI